MNLYRQQPYTLAELNLLQNQRVEPVQEPLSQKMGRGIGEFLLDQGVISDPRRAYRTGQTMSGILGFLPGIGDAQAGDEFATAAQEGDALGMGLGLMSAVPLVGKAVDPAVKSMQTAKGYIPQATQKAYKLFREKDGELYPLFVRGTEKVETQKWLDAKSGKKTKDGKVESSLGNLAYRAGWHAGDAPASYHIGGVASKGERFKVPKVGGKGMKTVPQYRPKEQVWAEVEMPADYDWQSIANSRAGTYKSGEHKGKTKAVDAHITDQIPFGGFYKYKTNPNMKDTWMISGNMRVNRPMPREEIDQIGLDLPTLDRFIIENDVKFSELTGTAKKELKKNYPELYEAMTK